MTERSEGGHRVEDLPATARSTGEPPGPELTAGAPIDPATSATESTADDAGCAGPGPTAAGGGTGGRPEASIDEQLGAATASVTKAADDVIVALRTLVATDEGHQYVGAQVNRAGDTIETVLRDLWANVGGTRKKP